MKPMLFNTEMVRALLEGSKTVTRRPVKPWPSANVNTLYRRDGTDLWRTPGENCWLEFRAPCVPGDVLWVRETWTLVPDGSYVYKASVECPDAWRGTWHPSIHMPREAARIFLRVTNVRVEQLKDITPEQIDAEGCKEWAYSAATGEPLPSGPSWFRVTWDRTIKPADLPRYGWEANPWVWVIEFERIGKVEALGGGGDE